MSTHKQSIPVHIHSILGQVLALKSTSSCTWCACPNNNANPGAQKQGYRSVGGNPLAATWGYSAMHLVSILPQTGRQKQMINCWMLISTGTQCNLFCLMLCVQCVDVYEVCIYLFPTQSRLSFNSFAQYTSIIIWFINVCCMVMRYLVVQTFRLSCQVLSIRHRFWSHPWMEPLGWWVWCMVELLDSKTGGAHSWFYEKWWSS